MEMGLIGIWRRSLRKLTLASALCFSCSLPAETLTLISRGATWRYSDTAGDLGTAWRSLGYDDSGWGSGPAQLGYGDGDEATRISSSPVRPCYYFRHKFSVPTPSAFQSLSLEVLRDDGCVVYLNGQEVARYNMPAGVITYSSLASSATEYPWDPPQTIPNLLVAGDNVMAVEVHQGNSTSSDVSFDLALTGTSEILLSLDSPNDGTSEVPVPVSLAATASDPEGQPLAVKFYGRQAPDPVPDFSIVVLPDTQYYTDEINGGTKAIFNSQAQWIVDNREARNIVYVAHLGDISNNGDRYLDEWVNASGALYRLESATSALFPNGIPYGTAVGNHDQVVPTGDTAPTTYYNQYFGTSHFTGRSYYGGHYGNDNNNHYDLFGAGGLEFIVIYLEYDTTPDAAVLTWADALLKAHPTRRAIVVSHYLIETSAAWGIQGQAVYNALSDNSNLFLMLCGHNPGEARRADVSSGNTVHTLLSDYQGYANGGNGFLRVLRFSPSNNQIAVQTYSPWLNQYETDSSSEFTLSHSMQPGPGFGLIQENSSVSSGAQTTATWSGLQPNTAYEWYAVASKGLEITTSEVYHFTTGSGSSTPPVASAQSVTVEEDGTVAITLSGHDAEGGSLSYTVLSGPAQGTLSGTAPDLTYAPYADYHGQDSFTFQVSDGTQSSPPATVTITVAPVNDAPVAIAQTLTCIEDTSMTLTLSGSDADGDPLSYTVVSGPAQGTLSGTAPNLTYTPALNYSGPDSLEFAVSDGQFSAAAIVSLTVTAVNDAPVAVADSGVTAEDTPITVNVLANDSDIDGGKLVIAAVTPGAHGSVAIDGGTTITYTPNANYSGVDSFVYTVSDGNGGSASATVSITVDPVNDAPVAVADAYSVDQGATLAVLAPGVLGNDTDIDSSGLTVSAHTPPSNGRLTLNADGSFTYVPGTEFSGTDTFSYTVSDGTATAVGTVDISVNPANQPPVANPQSVYVLEDNLLAIQLSASDADGDSLSYSVTVDPTHGTLSGTAPALTYSPEANYNGADSFVYTVSDGNGGSASATVTITITPVDDPPGNPVLSAVAGDSVVFLSWSASSDPDGEAVLYDIYRRSVTATEYGTAQVTGLSTLTYADHGLENGTRYWYKVRARGATTDSAYSESNEASATPAQPDYNAYVFQNPTLASGSLSGGDFSVLKDPDGTVQALTEVKIGLFGQLDARYTLQTTTEPSQITSLELVVNVLPVAAPDDGAWNVDIWNGSAWQRIGTLVPGATSLTYKPPTADGYVASDGTIQVAISDGADIRKEKLDSLSIDALYAKISAGPVDPDNVPPAARGTKVTLEEDMPVDITLTATDADGDPLTYAVVSGPTSGTISGTPPNLTYTPNADYFGEDSFSFTVSDGRGGSSSAFVSLTVASVNDAPVANDDTATTTQGVDVTVRVLANDLDVEGDTLVISGIAQGTHGVVTVNLDGTLTYTPNAEFIGTDSFDYTISDGKGEIDTAAVTVTVTAPSTSPVVHVASIMLATVSAGKNVKATATVAVVDQAGQPVTGATVYGDWLFDGSSIGSVSGITDASGVAVLTSAPVKASSGSFRFTVADLALGGAGYDPAANFVNEVEITF